MFGFIQKMFDTNERDVRRIEREIVAPSVEAIAALVSAAQECEALRSLLDEAPKDDWVIRREITERLAEARAELDLHLDAKLQELSRSRIEVTAS